MVIPPVQSCVLIWESVGTDSFLEPTSSIYFRIGLIFQPQRFTLGLFKLLARGRFSLCDSELILNCLL